MGINIRSINVTNLGPINELNWNLGGFNLVYGHNEKGKSYLVEFIIREQDYAFSIRVPDASRIPCLDELVSPGARHHRRLRAGLA